MTTPSKNDNIEQGHAQERSGLGTPHVINAQYNSLTLVMILIISACGIILFLGIHAIYEMDLSKTDNENYVKLMLGNGEILDGQARYERTVERLIERNKRATTVKNTTHDSYLDVGTLDSVPVNDLEMQCLYYPLTPDATKPYYIRMLHLLQ